MTVTLDRTAGRGSAFPPAIADLMPQARKLAADLGEPPSRNRLMRELRIGAGKATAILDALTTRPADPDTDRTPAASTPTAPAGPAALSGPATLVTESRPAPPSGTPEPTAGPEPAAGPDGVRAAAPEEATAARPGVVVPGAAVAVRRVSVWPVWLLALPAFVAIWSGWVGLGGLTGFGTIHPLPGIWDSLALNTAITLPIGMETYAAFALRVWLSGTVPARARRFARWSAITSLAVGAAGQVAYHLMSAAGMTAAPWWITTVVACLPVAVLGMGAALAHLLREPAESATESEEVSR